MMGGSLGDVAGGQAEQPATAVSGAARSSGAGKRRDATRAMAVNDFLAKGAGGGQLPRRKGERKDREKSKRALGQSTHAVWKSEAEMVLRQQFDS